MQCDDLQLVDVSLTPDNDNMACGNVGVFELVCGSRNTEFADKLFVKWEG